jgi:hypothetical protein
MKIPLNAAPAAAPRRQRRAKEQRPGRHRRHADAGQAPQAHEKAGGYKRIEVYLGVEAAIALRQLMRNGRSARDVIESLLLAEKQRRKTPTKPGPS